ncbi:MAG: hypothetical protein LBH18_04450 [Spirochaetaceae bacterium]|jgi:hypothetical protein|nr:hypothetical protein [Spirochaetaceae bacterium]
MSEPLRKPKQSPESYNPKNKPEILNMMEESAGKFKMNNAYQVKTANGGSYIDNVPMLKWGEWKDNTYCGCMTALFDAAGISVSYEELMGLSGVCWQIIMRDDWDPSSQMPQNGKLCEKNIGDALGIDVYSIGDENQIAEQVKKNIDSGIPVLMVGGRGAPEWTLLCGYTVENGQDKYFGRTYFDCQHYKPTKETIENQSPIVPENEIFTDNRYFCFNGFPGWVPGALTRFYDKKCKPILRKQALKVSLETCITMFEQKSTESHKFGYDAYDVLISGFELNDEDYKKTCGNDCYHIGSLLDARCAANVYLELSVGLLDERNQTKLAEVAKLYKNITDNMLAAVPYNETTPVFNGTPDFTTATLTVAQRRKDIAAALRKNKELEREARVIIKGILDHWDD